MIDLRAFHDRALEKGNAPLSVLRQQVESWIEAHDLLVRLPATPISPVL